jgi:hypothetical protein
VRIAFLSLLLLFQSVARAQSVTMPAQVTVPAGRLASVQISYDGDDLKFDVPSSLDSFREYDPDPKKVRLKIIGYPAADNKPYQARIIAVTAKAGKLSDFAVCILTVGDTPTPTPGPTPGPGPEPKPDPAPLPDAKGLHVLMVYETGATLTPGQQGLIFGQAVRDYLNQKTPVGEDGKTHEWRIYDKDADTSGVPKVWQDAMKRERKSVPWLLISNPGKGGYEGPLPESPDKFLELVKKYESNP